MKIFHFLFLFFILNFNAQNFSISGKVFDYNNKPIENATVYLLKKKDSTIINFVGTNNRGSFSFKIPKQNEPIILNIIADKVLPFSKKYETIDRNIDLGIINLEKDLVKNIEEVKITVSPVKIKKDTVEYNASYLKVKPDDKIDELLKQIPGVETDEDGKFTVNGKPINKFLINGKPVFNKDGKIILQTFNADLIKKIQITTSKTKEETLTNRTPVTDSLTVNFNLDEKNNKGDIRNLNLGFGTNKRYDTKILLAKFKKQKNFALIAGTNNINVTDFSVNNFFENGNKNNAANGRTQNNGILKTTIFGANYSDEIDDKLEIEKLSAEYKNGDLETYSKTDKTTFLLDYQLKNLMQRKGNSDRKTYKVNTDATLQIDSLTHVILSFDFNNNFSENFSENLTSTSRDNQQLNKSSGTSKGESHNNSFVPYITLVKSFNKKNRSFTASVNNKFSENKNEIYNLQEILFYQSPENNEFRNQKSQNKNFSNLFGADIKYTEPISDSAMVTIHLNYDLQKFENNFKVNDFDTDTQQFSIYNPLLSNNLEQKNNFLNSGINYQLNKNKYNFSTGFNVDYRHINLTSIYNNQDYYLSKNYIFPEYEVSFNYKFSKTENLKMSNNANFSIPDASLLNPYIDISNPLITIQGNPNLKSSWDNNTSISYNHFNTAKSKNFFTRLSFNYANNDWVDYSYYDNLGKQFKTYTNLSGNKRLNVMTSYSKTYKWNGNSLKITPYFSMNYNYRKGFLNQIIFTSRVYNFTPRISLNLDLKDKLNLRTTYFFAYSKSNYTNYRIDETQNSRHNISINLTNYFFKKSLFFNNYFGFVRNSNISSDFNKNSYYLNSSITYQFYKKQMMLKLSAYDLLNQRQSVTRTIEDNYIEDNEQLVLKRYFMLSLIWNFSKSGDLK